MIGKALKNWTIIPKKSPNKPMIPRDSTINPTKVHLERINNMPNTKKMDPRLFVGRVKKMTVFCGPMINTTPVKNKILPRAKRALSKNVIIPKRKNKNPPNVNATPNSLQK